MKDLLDRYLAAVARELPARQRADIAAELRDELLTKIELREAARGRPLDRGELEALLIEVGNPLIVAGRYRKVQHLVGPEIFPLWWSGLKVTLGVIAAVYLVIVIVRAAFTGTATHAEDAVPSLLTSMIFAFGIVTLVAVAVERLNLQRFVYRWRPRQLPPVGARAKSPFERVVEIGMGAVFLLWWTGAIQLRGWLPAMGVLVVDLAPVFAVYFWPVLAYSAFELVINLTALLRPGWVRLNAAVTVVRSLAGAGLTASLLQAGHWLEISSGRLPALVVERAQTQFDLGLNVALVATVAGFAIAAALDARRLWLVIQDARAYPYAR
ncbi:hypothetical protein [Phenylobacterium sp.]|uniref:hypothetical protein n=1 Tax=Phenylobacterium sp. TaxID=1871053 RepID=UPI0025E66EE3|nr:hypothetical protein [Phenylobacterium sp.]